jgi:ABC-2 type transport system permease protein
MIGALLYLRLTSLRNQVVHRLARLRQPKYLLGALFAAGYFYYFVFRRLGTAAQGGAIPPQFAHSAGMLISGLICAAVCLVGVLRVSYAWIAPPEKAGLMFTEAEIAFLFPAPFTRKTLIHFRLLSSQFAILFSAALITIVFNRSSYLGGHRILHAVGWWIILSTIDLHVNGTNLMLSRLRETSSHFLLWRMAAVAAIAAYIVAVYRTSAGVVGAFMARADFGGMASETDRLVGNLHDSASLHWLTLPFRIVLGPYLATGYREFAAALLPALAVVALHYLWVSTSEARFEEGSIALAAKRAAMRAAMQRGEAPRLGGSRAKPLSGPFPLPPRGLPEVAFLWKNLLSLRSSVFSRRTLAVVIGVAAWMYFVTGGILRTHAMSDRADALGIIVLMCCGIVAAYTLLLGPQIARQDLRSDLPNADLLKTFPIEGWRLALGELLAPTAILTSILWVTIIVAATALDPGRKIGWLTPPVRGTVALCLALVAPLLCMIQLIVPNTVMILMPAWYQTTRSRAAGIEMFGQRLLFGVLQLLFAFMVVAPAAGAAVLIVFASSWILGVIAAAVLATAASMLILAGEAAVGVWFLGERFEKFDLSTEAR